MSNDCPHRSISSDQIQPAQAQPSAYRTSQMTQFDDVETETGDKSRIRMIEWGLEDGVGKSCGNETGASSGGSGGLGSSMRGPVDDVIKRIVLRDSVLMRTAVGTP